MNTTCRIWSLITVLFLTSSSIDLPVHASGRSVGRPSLTIGVETPTSGGWRKEGNPTISVGEKDSHCGESAWSVYEVFGSEGVHRSLDAARPRGRGEYVWLRLALRGVGDDGPQSATIIVSESSDLDSWQQDVEVTYGPASAYIEPTDSGKPSIYVEGLSTQEWSEIQVRSSSGVSMVSVYPGGLDESEWPGAIQVDGPEVQVGPRFKIEGNIFRCPSDPTDSSWIKFGKPQIQVIPGLPDPLGGNNAWSVETGEWADGIHQTINESFSSSVGYRLYLRAYLKADSSDSAALYLRRNTGSGFRVIVGGIQVLSGPGTAHVGDRFGMGEVEGLGSEEWTQVEAWYEIESGLLGVIAGFSPGGVDDISDDFPAKVIVFQPELELVSSKGRGLRRNQ